MQIQGFSKHIFWNYATNIDLPESIVAEQVILYGEIEDIVLLFKNTPRESILSAVTKIKITDRWKKRVNFIEKVFLYNS